MEMKIGSWSTENGNSFFLQINGVLLGCGSQWSVAIFQVLYLGAMFFVFFSLKHGDINTI